MATNDVETPRGNEKFDFNAWIVKNELNEVKQYFIKHKMTSIACLSTQSKEFSQFIADQTLLMTKSQFIPKVFNALQTLQTQYNDQRDIYNSRVVVISETEKNIVKSMKSNLKYLENMEVDIDNLKQQSLQTASSLKAMRNAQIEEAKDKIKKMVDHAIKALQSKEKKILDELDGLLEETKHDDDDKSDDNDPILKETMNYLVETKQILIDKIKECNDYIHSSEHQDIEKRKQIIYDINDKIVSKFNECYLKSKENVMIMKQRMVYNNKLLQQTIVDVDINDDEYVKLMNSVENIASVKHNPYLPLKAPTVNADKSKKRLWNEMTKQKYTALIKWLEDNGAKFSYFKEKNLNGIYATSNVEKGCVFAKIPLKCIMTLEIAKASIIGQRLMKCADKIGSPHTWIAAYLLTEKRKGIDSFWFPYIDMLPTQFDTMPIYFNENDMKQLNGSMTVQKIKSRLYVYRQQYTDLRDIFESEHISLDDFVWARLVVITRIFGFYMDSIKTSGLVPFADLLDHTDPTLKPVSWTYDENNSAFIVKASKGITIGDELFVTYGKKCNSRFFVNYGVISKEKTENKANQAVISLNVCSFAVSEQDLDQKIYRKLHSVLEKYDFDGYDIKCFVDKEYGKVDSSKLFGMARLMSCDEKEYDSVQNTRSIERINVISISNEKKAVKLISDAAQAALNKFDTSLAEDNELLMDKTSYPVNSNHRNIILMRKGEKEVLHIYAELYHEMIQFWPTVEKNTSFTNLKNLGLVEYAAELLKFVI